MTHRWKSTAAVCALLVLATATASAQTRSTTPPKAEATAAPSKPAEAKAEPANKTPSKKRKAKSDEDEDQPALDPVTAAVQRDILTQLRIAAIAFEHPENQGEALSGIIGAFLRRNQEKDALIDFKVIQAPLWKARALIHFAEHSRRQRDLLKAKAILREAAALIDPELAVQDKGRTLKEISRRQAEYEDYASARQTAMRIPSPNDRILQLSGLGALQSGSPNRERAAGATESFALAFQEAKKAPIGRVERVKLLIRIAEAVTLSNRKPMAVKILNYTYTYLNAQKVPEHDTLLSTISADFVDANNTVRAMSIVRSLKRDALRARTLASIARAIALNGSLDGAAPLFFLALQDMDAITDPFVRSDLLKHIIEEQTRAGRLADAFTAIGRIKDKDAQQQVMFAMGKVLIESGKPEEAVKLVNYISDIGMRAQLYAHRARQLTQMGQRDAAGDMLLKALSQTGSKPEAATLMEALPLIHEVQAELGPTRTHKEVLKRVQNLLLTIPDKPEKVPVMTRIARSEAIEGQHDAAERSLGLAWRIAWFNKEKDMFPTLLHDIAAAQLDVGELLLAFDTAARIPDEAPEDPGEFMSDQDVRDNAKNKALTAVAVAAAVRGEGQLALRAARKIAHPTGRASAYNEIALALPTRAQVAKKKRPKDRPGSRKF